MATFNLHGRVFFIILKLPPVSLALKEAKPMRGYGCPAEYPKTRSMRGQFLFMLGSSVHFFCDLLLSRLALYLSRLMLTHCHNSTPSEAVWIFDVALSFWAIIKFGTDLGSSAAAQVRTTVTCKLYSPSVISCWQLVGSGSSDADGWIQNGGPVSFQGIGDLAELNAAKILSVFCERLENMPWGIADRFRHVLVNLSKEE